MKAILLKIWRPIKALFTHLYWWLSFYCFGGMILSMILIFSQCSSNENKWRDQYSTVTAEIVDMKVTTSVVEVNKLDKAFYESVSFVCKDVNSGKEWVINNPSKYNIEQYLAGNKIITFEMQNRELEIENPYNDDHSLLFLMFLLSFVVIIIVHGLFFKY